MDDLGILSNLVSATSNNLSESSCAIHYKSHISTMDFGANLTSVQFEEMCRDLLVEIGYTDVSWRKGTSLDASPSDQGRDIEATLSRSEPDGATVRERWFVECKHWKPGVPPTALQPALAWANAECPDTLLIIASGFLSNPSKEYLKTYEANHKPKFRIKVWEADKLEQLLFGRPRLLNKFGLAPRFPFTQILHPAHLHFLRHPPINSLNHFFAITDSLDHRDRDSWFFSAFLHVINPPFAEPESPDQSIGELAQGVVSYHEFRKALIDASQVVSSIFLIQSAVSHSLSLLLVQGDTTSLKEAKDTHRHAITFFKRQLETCAPEDRPDLEGCIQMSEEKLLTLEQDLEEGYKRYCEFCRQVLVPLFDEKMEIPEHVRERMARGKSDQSDSQSP
jgi:hypothetical protein